MSRSPSLQALLITLYLGSVVPLLLGLGVAIYLEYRAFLVNEHRSTLYELLDALVAPEGATSAPAPGRLAALLNVQLRDTDFQAVLLDLHGRAIGGVEPLLSLTEHAALRNGAPSIRREARTDDGIYVIYARAVPTPDGGIAGTVEGQFSIAAVATDLAQLTRWLAITIGGAILLVIALAPVVARLATRPLQGLMATARAVGQGKLDTRANLPTVREPRELALTINAMLDQVQSTLDAETRATTALRRFAADASHELRAPLAVFSSGLDVLAEALHRHDLPQAHEILARLEREQETMRRLVDDLLLLARMDQPHAMAPLRRAPVEPLPLLEAVVERARLLATGQRIEFRWPTHLPPTLDADPEALQRALSNLVENALRHTQPGRTVTLSIAPEADGCRFCIADEGEGIAPEHLPRLGERFYRVDTARSRATGGAGLGLAIVKAIAAAHGGRLELQSIPGAGVTAQLVIPARPPSTTARPGWLAPVRNTAPLPLARPGRAFACYRLRLGMVGLGIGLVVLLVSWAIHLTSIERPTAAPANQEDGGLTTVGMTAPEPVAPLPLQTGALDQAVAIATARLGGVALRVAYADEAPSQIVEVTLSDGSIVVVNQALASIIAIEPGPQGRGRGVERQRHERAALAALASSGTIQLGFADAAASARRVIGEPAEIALVLVEGQLHYKVASTDDRVALVDVQTGAVFPECHPCQP